MNNELFEELSKLLNELTAGEEKFAKAHRPIPWKKDLRYWLMTDGKIVGVNHEISHTALIKDAGYEHPEEYEAGLIRVCAFGECCVAIDKCPNPATEAQLEIIKQTLEEMLSYLKGWKLEVRLYTMNSFAQKNGGGYDWTNIRREIKDYDEVEDVMRLL